MYLIGTTKKYTKATRLCSALVAQGAREVNVKPKQVEVEWDNGNTCIYPILKDGRIDGLEWDFYANNRRA